MKKIFIIAALAFTVISCNDKKDPEPEVKEEVKIEKLADDKKNNKEEDKKKGNTDSVKPASKQVTSSPKNNTKKPVTKPASSTPKNKTTTVKKATKIVKVQPKPKSTTPVINNPKSGSKSNPVLGGNSSNSSSTNPYNVEREMVSSSGKKHIIWGTSSVTKSDLDQYEKLEADYMVKLSVHNDKKAVLPGLEISLNNQLRKIQIIEDNKKTMFDAVVVSEGYMNDYQSKANKETNPNSKQNLLKFANLHKQRLAERKGRLQTIESKLADALVEKAKLEQKYNSALQEFKQAESVFFAAGTLLEDAARVHHIK
ncbi:hypothetical protein [Flammeovirga kamogawensis]|uniref:DUF4349 domain-containing protein n=1 Tax=Flammeovirga kamogawensis TaxID=373891 RepID=A0ABX8H0S7_9BACT|nr:hypothetical protein [Flammeovirga kamogawensis]MBB6462383.1 hypothetical protein [Flammeovirga kamogawensis]QWG09496.1 hypothetical protein KM029_23095 [Flammeovirga kamogawensis]TRX65012.1 hypothetical protein EO216_20995 [Flammeovirga kamogawensis]